MRMCLALTVLLGLVAGCGGDEYALPYSSASYDVADARRAFAAAGVVLEPRSQSLPVVTTLGNHDDILEVDVWGSPEAVSRTGFRDLARGPDCTTVNRTAIRWRGNVRAIVDCDLAGSDDAAWVARATRALGRL
jgi:hypothetical protein